MCINRIVKYPYRPGKVFPVALVLLMVWQCAGYKGGHHQYKATTLKIPQWLIGYSEFRTNLPGGRQANVNTKRAVIINADGSGGRVLATELVHGGDTMS
jgi:hypothetical protein